MKCYLLFRNRETQIRFVNAVLRNVDRERKEILAKTSIFDNIEPWLANEWINCYGEEKARIIVEASMRQSPVFVSLNLPPNSPEEERKEKIQRIISAFSQEKPAEFIPHGSVRIPATYGGMVTKWPLYDEGEWWVQDASASLPAIALYKALANGSSSLKDLHVVDLCSSPGGKTAQLCAFGFGKVTAVEINQRRIRLLKENLVRLKMEKQCKIVLADGSNWKPDDELKIDGILVDAPCSATGVGSRRPDVLRRSPDIDELVQTQRKLIVHAADNLLQPGGIMVYSTCSLLKQESEDQINWLQSRAEGAKMETIPFISGEIPGFDSAVDENGWLRVLPGILPGSLSHCDGFFVARLRRLS